MVALLAIIGSLQPYLPVMVGGSVACAVFTFFALRYRSNVSQRRFEKEVFDLWEPANNTSADRRASVRREGAPVVVYLQCAALGGAKEAYVIDRSTGGVKIASMKPLAIGGSLLIRAKNALDDTPWTTCIVRSCRSKGSHFELGCEFEQTPPWNVLLLFG